MIPFLYIEILLKYWEDLFICARLQHFCQQTQVFPNTRRKSEGFHSVYLNKAL